MEFRIEESGRECIACRTFKAWAEFNKGTGSHGHDNRCRECTKAYRRSPEYRERSRQRQEKRLANQIEREKQNERMRVYHHRPDVIEKLQTPEARRSRSEYGKKYWMERGRERVRSMSPEEKQELNRRANIRMRKFLSDPRNRMSNRMSCAVKRLLHGQKKGRHWEDLVGYTIDDLRAHLERLWEPDMTWENYGKSGWHIDHVKPITAFRYDSYEDADFKTCWALENLMPRWCTTEIAKAHGSAAIGNINKGGLKSCEALAIH